MKARIGRAVSVCALAGLLSAGEALATGMPSSWNRFRDWNTEGLNPARVSGEAVWAYEFIAAGGAGGLGSSNPWYTQPRGVLSWDPSWYGGTPAFARADDISPPVFRRFMTHNVHTSTQAFVPAVRWIKPASFTDSVVTITGSLLVVWDGPDGVGEPNRVDVVITRINESLGTQTVLFSSTVDKPEPFPSVGDSRLLPISLSVSMNAGDSVLVTHRGRTGFEPSGSWINLHDSLTFAPIPAPGAGVALGLAGLAAVRRRRR